MKSPASVACPKAHGRRHLKGAVSGESNKRTRGHQPGVLSSCANRLDSITRRVVSCDTPTAGALPICEAASVPDRLALPCITGSSSSVRNAESREIADTSTPAVPGTGKAVNPAYESVARASVTLKDIKSFRELGPAARAWFPLPLPNRRPTPAANWGVSW